MDMQIKFQFSKAYSSTSTTSLLCSQALQPAILSLPPRPGLAHIHCHPQDVSGLLSPIS